MDVELPRIGTLERVLFLKRISGLSALGARDLATLADRARERSWPRGAVLLRAGEPVGAMHFVVEGRVKLRRHGRALGCAGAGSAIGATLLLAEDAAGIEAVAEGHTLTLALDRESFLDTLEERFAIFRDILRETCRELVELFVRNPVEAAPTPRGEAPRPPFDRELDLVDRIVLLRRRPFEASSIDALAELSQRLDELRLPAGTVLWRRADRADRMMFVVSGRVRCEPEEREAAFWMGPGQPLGTLELLGELPRWYDAVVEEAATVLQGEVEELLDVFEDNPDMGLILLAYLTRSAVELQERVAEREGSLPKLYGCADAGA